MQQETEVVCTNYNKHHGTVVVYGEHYPTQYTYMYTYSDSPDISNGKYL